MRLNIPFKYRPLVIPGVAFLIIFILTATAGQFLFSRIFELQTSITQSKQKNESLEAKKTLLSGLNKTELKEQVNKAVAAVPNESSATPSLITLRSLAQNRNVNITQVHINDKSKSGSKAESKTVDVEVTAQSDIPSILLFLNDLRKATPIMKVANVGFDLKGGVLYSNISLQTTWSSLPSTIGKVEDPIDNLTPSERAELNQLQTLSAQESTRSAVLPPQGRENPFTY